MTRTDINRRAILHPCLQMVKARIEALFVMMYLAVRNRRAALA